MLVLSGAIPIKVVATIISDTQPNQPVVAVVAVVVGACDGSSHGRGVDATPLGAFEIDFVVRARVVPAHVQSTPGC